jgi:hypothetical protein
MKYKNKSQRYRDDWLQSEIYFMRFVGGAALVLALLMFSGGLVAETGIDAWLFNTAAVGLFVAGGMWALWVSSREERMASMVEDVQSRSLNRVRLMGGVEIVIGLLFLVSGSFVWIALGIFSILTGGWYLRRSLKIQELRQIEATQ